MITFFDMHKVPRFQRLSLIPFTRISINHRHWFLKCSTTKNAQRTWGFVPINDLVFIINMDNFYLNLI